MKAKMADPSTEGNCQAGSWNQSGPTDEAVECIHPDTVWVTTHSEKDTNRQGEFAERRIASITAEQRAKRR